MTRIDVRKFSRRLLHAVYHNDEVDLWSLFDDHRRYGLWVPGVECPCRSLPGDDDDHLFLYTFFRVLRFHVAAGQIQGVFLDEEERQLWQCWVEGRLKPPRLARTYNWIYDADDVIDERFSRIASVLLVVSPETVRHIEIGFSPRHLAYVGCALIKRDRSLWNWQPCLFHAKPGNTRRRHSLEFLRKRGVPHVSRNEQ